MVWAAAWLGPTLPTLDHLASWGGWELGMQSFPCQPRQVPKRCMVPGDRGTQSPLLPLKARTLEVLTPSVVTFSWDTRQTELPPVTRQSTRNGPARRGRAAAWRVRQLPSVGVHLIYKKLTGLVRESCRMASPATPKGRGAPPDDATSLPRAGLTL